MRLWSEGWKPNKDCNVVTRCNIYDRSTVKEMDQNIKNKKIN